jgi:hypothetical protein
MPIRMVDDQEKVEQPEDRGSAGGGNLPGGGSGLLALLPLLFGLFKSKAGLFLLLIGGVLFFAYRSGCMNKILQSADASKYSPSGYEFNKEKFLSTDIYEPTDAGNPVNSVRESVDLSPFAPPIGDQGSQGSCVAWSSAYAAQTILEAASKGVDPNAIKFSPSFMYNQIGLDNCQGSYIERAMAFMTKVGGVPLTKFPYQEDGCDRVPNGNDPIYNEAAQFRIRGFQRLTVDESEEVSIQSVKEHLNKDAPVVIGMLVGDDFTNGMMGKDLYQPANYSMTGKGGHAMCLVGYDDRKYGGAFKIFNSWGKVWGNNGYAWVRYADFQKFTREAYGINPLPKNEAMKNLPLECNIGLVTNEKKYIPLKSKGGNVFQTTAPIKVGTKFRIEIQNLKECNIYVFGEETNGTPYTLFPYTAKHSPFCGIAGSRLFPKNQAMAPDAEGNKDYMLLVVSKEPQNVNQLKGTVQQLKTYKPPTSIAFNATKEGRVYFKSTAGENTLVPIVVEIDKTQ